MAAKYYPQNDEKPMVAKEPTVAYGREPKSMPRLKGDSGIGDEEYSLRPYTMEEINARLDEAEADYASGRVMTCEEANAEIRRMLPWLS